MLIRQATVADPFFSVCIPQHNRTDFLLKVCESLAAQTFRSFEVCISDDCSTDGGEERLLDFLKGSGLSFTYVRQETNLRYDGNLRASIGLARGKLCFLLGNDDALSSPDTLRELHDEIVRAGEVSVVVTNFEDFETGARTHRVREPGMRGGGPAVAASCFRNFAFVSGIVLDRARAQALATDRWDGSEMYQMYVGCRIIAEGGAVLGVERSVVRKDVRIPGQEVDSYARRPRARARGVVERKLPIVELGRLVVDAISPSLPVAGRVAMAERVFFQLFAFTYPYWLVEYRRVQSWKYALEFCLGMRPRNTMDGLELGSLRRLRLYLLFGVSSLLGLSAPHGVFDALRPAFYRLAKSYRLRGARA